ncbi:MULTISPECIES: response regulator transcription factor [Aliarcobacter]|jgi:DNA-binding response OmpR family regulator|uniref:DNA-binding response regulator n=2 Tax=Aliarcobacter skirrowii TaxID=28200 RepID=A0A2U2C211_9BACT|nr:response regulator transcription factor [Aliarcobacter skirrowii]AXX85411.1 two-component system response regulator [Aliarcobacter skirrowii CCUG 10374]AZL54477.1 response regulator transcription factor [Aliarcobacter skirrowii]KAB0621178.1 response regulator transcription factor [Aliarcobacter skirrowii CCUG 10374]MCT7446418.1 response regulator transcription factor [Aliarcobacter skirrowii]MDD3024947.1 response regulator transcription factor [Aliarcobacter skirrowii]
MKILLLEDELMLNNTITEYLKNIGHMVDSYFDGQDVLDNIENRYDLLILDVNVPTKDGFMILDELNSKKIHIPTIFISAQIDIEDITKAYSLGAREYLKKPFHLEELGIKINLILKKEQRDTSHIKFSENYSYSKDKQTLYFNGEPQNLTKKQLEIIHILALNINMIVDFEQFRIDVWDSENIDNPTIRAEISRLKKSLKEDFIKNIRGLGYKIDRYYSI